MKERLTLMMCFKPHIFIKGKRYFEVNDIKYVGFILVSWRVHRVLGKLLCSFHSNEIDRLIDCPRGCRSLESHDSSRYDVDTLERLVILIKRKYGDEGLCYFVLHHYLDRLVDILASLISNYYESYALGYSASKMSFEEIYEHIRTEAFESLQIDPKNILTLLVYDLTSVLNALYWMYGGKRKRRQRRHFEEVLEKAYARISSNSNLQQLRNIVLEVLRNIRDNIDCVIYATLIDEGFKSKGTLNKIAAVLQVKVAKYRYYARMRGSYYDELANKLLDEENIIRFIGGIVEASHNRCNLLSR